MDSAPDMMNRSVIRAMTLLSRISNYPDGATATELANDVGLARPTVFRLLLSLEHSGFLAKNEGVFSLGWEIARLGRRADPHRGIAAHVQVNVDQLATEINETVGYAVVTGPTTFDLVAEAQSTHLLSPNKGYIGEDLPLHASATGKILLADLDADQLDTLLTNPLEEFTRYTITEADQLRFELAEIRSRRYSILDGELEEGLYAVAVPVNDKLGNVIGVLSASGLDQRMKSAHIQSFIEPLRATAEELTQILYRHQAD
ncbi:IclR family transcriptional regulator [Brevibacterium marinum]|uniref:DNA-binding IclR family transcriptional regulator n=2 Tax=Brevibacterium marinum TaxID=418643 RepID=A0A846S011_9MICO|nr:IclR family transcriptional regulator [Brevibacterium marinum]NJC54972.1 DNA-binding IclR family transcriptional regulator [Brevibacterium marinum]